ncbi:prepilin-type N-terminal cleavage/methylation domain-containing protein [Xylophilus rhododendri]|uniref:Type II secretion system protein H n=1 Tax=Xylophilus rhododendri TaxID=2697032 RepID=A0A857JCF3_9BURK|nr:GspH/FimT family pseudopilin [Xylophilus rhododendri]QHJ01691.1 prepilin-type N-terminal cleavage/methylation domain-containing protein [Xylophilus rhododendri]
MKQTRAAIPALRRYQGFTLVELMVTLAIVVILGLLAAPSLQGLTAKIRLTGVGSQFTGNLLRARSEAVSRNACTVMCLSTTTGDTITSDANGVTGGPSCANTGTNWQQGWIVFYQESCSFGGDTSAIRPAQPADYIAIQPPIAADYRLDAQGTGDAFRFSFDGTGRPPQGSAIRQFNLNYQNTTSAYTQQYGYNICVDALGRTRTIAWNLSC